MTTLPAQVPTDTALMAIAAYGVIALLSSQVKPDHEKLVRAAARMATRRPFLWRVLWWIPWLGRCTSLWLPLWGVGALAALCGNLILNSELLSKVIERCGPAGWLMTYCIGMVLAAVVALGPVERLRTVAAHLEVRNEELPETHVPYMLSLMVLFVDVNGLSLLNLVVTSLLATLLATTRLSRSLQSMIVLVMFGLAILVLSYGA